MDQCIKSSFFKLLQQFLTVAVVLNPSLNLIVLPLIQNIFINIHEELRMFFNEKEENFIHLTLNLDYLLFL